MFRQEFGNKNEPNKKNSHKIIIKILKGKSAKGPRSIERNADPKNEVIITTK